MKPSANDSCAKSKSMSKFARILILFTISVLAIIILFLIIINMSLLHDAETYRYAWSQCINRELGL